MRADRLLSVLLLLQAHRRLTGRELAKRLEVSLRTVHRDMEALSAAGVPVYALRGARGGWQLDEDWRTQVPGLDDAELRAFLMVQPRVLGDVKLAGAAERALGKIMAALPSGLRERAVSIRQRLHVDTTGWRGTTENLAMLPVVQDAVSNDRKLSMVYRRDVEPSERIVDPLGLVAKGSTWYLVANTAKGFRTFRVSRIDSATVLDVPCERPSDFDLAAYWKESTQRLVPASPPFEALLRLEPKTAAQFQRWHNAWTVEKPGDGWVTMRVVFDREDDARFVVLGLGTRAEVVEPHDLREWVAGEATRVQSAYSKS